MDDYRRLDRPEDIDALREASRGAPFAIFKHSTSCSISRLAKSRLDKALRAGEIPVPVYLVDLLRHRDVSNRVAEALGVRHESPQLLLVSDGEADYVASHLDIDPYALAGRGAER